MERQVENNLKTVIERSGNSDVDLTVNVDIDTTPIAYGILCSIFAKGDLTELELEKAIQKLDHLIDRDKNKKRRKKSEENKPKLYDFPQPPSRRNWF
ncbi:hypothetical protein [Bacillus mesophilum]|uniref:Uncharacterized protein n=1 Tax=Bacillus mesophilum TaxID=1071718 RepID=A0A7V7UW98_9BACI|nr:hypothetical protein [Bacillus mesophilum]KAB2333956.1 hypothetical protein F7732_07685 [Bacillus mesophilum]